MLVDRMSAWTSGALWVAIRLVYILPTVNTFISVRVVQILSDDSCGKKAADIPK